MIFYVAIFIALASTMETVGIWGRVLGAYQKSPAFGYSLHVRVATLGRFFTLLAAPSLGYLVDQGISANDVALCGSIAFLLIAASAGISFLLPPSSYVAAFHLISKYISRESTIAQKKPPLRNNLRFGAVCSTAFLFTAVGLILVNLLGSLLPDFRASIVQMSAIFTTFGTLLHVFLIDPKLSYAADEDKNELYNLSMMYIMYRAASALVLSIIFFMTYKLI